ncbi:MAG TPA: helix-turn-helix domain-containing protein [Thermomicrobiaceae bacterium]|nr:helix-turn-helix domain-containing protein [Thermomicrobiaceae bacterium]
MDASAANEQRRRPAIATRQRIGPAIRELRLRQGRSLSDLAAHTGISVSYLSRLEKGRSVPSFTLLSRLGSELGVDDLGFFVSAEREATAVDEDLRQGLGRSGIPESVWPEFLELSITARRALAESLQARNGPRRHASNGRDN